MNPDDLVLATILLLVVAGVLYAVAFTAYHRGWTAGYDHALEALTVAREQAERTPGCEP